eukprot:6945574-Prymnesium_polylepis.1
MRIMMCSFGTSVGRRPVSGTLWQASESTLLAPLIRPWPHKIASEIVNLLTESETARECRVSLTLERVSCVVGAMGGDIADSVLAHMSLQDPLSALDVEVKRIKNGFENQAASECVITCVSALVGSGCPVLICGLIGDRTDMFLATASYIPIAKTQSTPQMRSAQIASMVSTLSSVGLVHMSLANESKPSDYHNKMLVCSHSARDCVFAEDLSPVWTELAMLCMLLSDLAVKDTESASKQRYLLNRIELLSNIPEHALTSPTLKAIGKLKTLWTESVGSSSGAPLPVQRFEKETTYEVAYDNTNALASTHGIQENIPVTSMPKGAEEVTGTGTGGDEYTDTFGEPDGDK